MIKEPLRTWHRNRWFARALVLIPEAATLLFMPLLAPAKPPSNETSESAPTAGIGQAGRIGSATFIGSGTAEATAVATGFIIAKYEATENQRKVAEERARQAYQAMPAEKKKALKAKKIRYIAVDTQKDRRMKGRKAIMLWDTQSQEIVGRGVYDVAAPPPLASRVTFETYSAEYIGEGRRGPIR
jgi:hypothetical protein